MTYAASGEHHNLSDKGNISTGRPKFLFSVLGDKIYQHCPLLVSKAAVQEGCRVHRNNKSVSSCAPCVLECCCKLYLICHWVQLELVLL